MRSQIQINGLMESGGRCEKVMKALYKQTKRVIMENPSKQTPKKRYENFLIYYEGKYSNSLHLYITPKFQVKLRFSSTIGISIIHTWESNRKICLKHFALQNNIPKSV